MWFFIDLINMLLSDTVAKPIFEVAASIYKFLYMLKAMFLYWKKFMGLIISTFTWTFYFSYLWVLLEIHDFNLMQGKCMFLQNNSDSSISFLFYLNLNPIADTLCLNFLRCWRYLTWDPIASQTTLYSPTGNIKMMCIEFLKNFLFFKLTKETLKYLLYKVIQTT